MVKARKIGVCVAQVSECPELVERGEEGDGPTENAFITKSIFKIIENIDFEIVQRGVHMNFAGKRKTRQGPASPGVLLWNALFGRKTENPKT